jgi:hypothetical protein
MPAFQAPYKASVADFRKASEEGEWSAIAGMISRNFDEVELKMSDTEARIVEVETAATFLGNKEVYSLIPTALRSTASLTYVAWPVGEALSATFTKQQDATRLIITVTAGGYLTGGGAGFDYGVSIDGGAVTHVRRAAISTAAEHGDFTGYVEVSGLAAGPHTIALQAKVLAWTLNADTNDHLFIVVEEVP